MIEYEQQLFRLMEHKTALDELKDALDMENLRSRIAALEEQTTQPGFWDDSENSQKILREASQLKSKAEAFDNLENRFADTRDIISMADEEGDLTLLDEVAASIDTIIADIEKQSLAVLLTGEYDSNNAILTLHGGAGGTEAQDWAQMLMRMYMRWSERRGFKAKVLDLLDGEEAGIKSATILIEGVNAYGYLKSEMGVHRLVRVSPFDASGRRHTSFAAVEVMPEINDDIELDIKDDDLRIDTYRSGGAGGQHVNKTDSAVRITHLPTGIVVACQNERSQRQNREVAMKMLKSKLIEIKEREHLDKISDIKGEQKEIAWGSQIRSYVFMPYTLVKDHRTSFEVGNVNAVMDGDIDGFINAYLKQNNKK